MTRRGAVCPLMMLLVVLGTQGCLYQWGSDLTDHAYKSIYIPIFRNETTERHIESDLTEALRRFYNQAGGWTVVSDKDRADLIMTGSISRFERTPLSETRRDDVLELQVAVVAHVMLTDARTGEVLRRRTISESGEATLVIGQTEQQAAREALTDVAEKIFEAMERHWF
jgi:hypothetical protein